MFVYILSLLKAIKEMGFVRRKLWLLIFLYLPTIFAVLFWFFKNFGYDFLMFCYNFLIGSIAFLFNILSFISGVLF